MAWPSVTVTGGPAGGQFANGTGSFNLAHTCAAGDTKLVLLIGTGATAAGDFVTGITYNGASFTRVANQSDGSFERACIWSLDSPTTGSAFNIVISYATGAVSTQFGYGAISFDGAAATMGAPTGATGSTANPSVTVADSASGDIVISVLANDNAAAAQSVSTGTVIFDAEDVNGDSDFTAQYQTATGANTVCTFTQSDTTGGAWAIVGLAVKSAAPTGPTINTQPVSQRVPAGSTASFSVTATASGGSLTYQWQNNVGGTFANISGETASSYTTGTLTAGTAYAVRCVVTDSNGSTNTSHADVWTPVTKPAPWAGLYARATKRDDVGAWLITPTSKTAGKIVDSALWGVTTTSGTHSTSGALTSSSATIAGAAAHSALHATSGALASAAATIAGSATHLTLHTTTGALTAGSATVAGAANHAVGHATTGALVAGSATISGAAQHQHATSGALVAGSATIAGATDHTTAGATHSTSGALSADAATIAGTSAHLTLHTTTGALVAGFGAIAGAALHPHTTSGALVAQAATVAGAANHSALHATSGALAPDAATIAGVAVHSVAGVHAASGALVADSAQISGAATLISTATPPGGGGGPSAASGGMLHRYKLLQAFKDKKERDEAVAKLPKATEKERVILRKSARALIKAEPVNYKELESRVSQDLESVGLSPAPNHLDWLLYFLRVEAHAMAQAQIAAQQDEETMQVLLMALME